ncbi:hypothetical protein GCM10007901_06530 [Dyella acidisoli]|uniref:Uncharacterized protein n=1 Tax=Dyella acidisoli TaxID=1867834 RepID=A0ABQ5XKT1_9GAMM|nr:hypothetical protein GCM10007901_06530 [Dyella acidisoli]
MPPLPSAFCACTVPPTCTSPPPLATICTLPSGFAAVPVAWIMPLVLIASAPRLSFTAASITFAACSVPATLIVPCSPACGCTVMVPLESVT